MGHVAARATRSHECTCECLARWAKERVRETERDSLLEALGHVAATWPWRERTGKCTGEVQVTSKPPTSKRRAFCVPLGFC